MILTLSNRALLASVILGGALFSNPKTVLGAIRYSILGGTDLATYQISNSGSSVNSRSGLGWTAGGRLGFTLSPTFEFEPGLFYQARSTERLGITQRIPYLEIPIRLQFHLGSHFYAGLAAVFDKVVGDVQLSAPGISTLRLSSGDFGIRSSDIGFQVSLGAKLPIRAQSRFLLEASYGAGLQNQFLIAAAYPDTSFRWRQVILLTGVQFGSFP